MAKSEGHRRGKPVIERRKMARYLFPVDAWAMSFGCIVGWGAFVMPGTTFLPLAGPAGTLAAMILSTALMLVIGYNYAWLMRRRPFKGGSYSYTKEAFGRDHAFLCAWFLCLSYLTIVFLNATALFIISRVLFDDVPQISTSVAFAGIEIYPWEAALSVSVLIIVGIALILGKSAMQMVQRVLAIILMAGAVILTAACIPVFDWGRLLTEHGIAAAQGAGANAAGGGLHSIGAVMTLLLLAPWAFAGFEIASLETPHFDFPIRKSWRVIASAIVCGGFVYTAMTCVSASVRPAGFGSWQEYVSGLDHLSGIEGVPVFYAAISRMGRAGLVVVTITALAAILTGVIGAYRGTMRMLSTMADDKILSAEFRGTTFCIIFIMGVSSIFTFLGRNTLNWFVELTSLGATIGFAYTSAAAFRIASREGSRTTQITGLIGAVFSGIFAVVQLASRIGSVETMCAPSFLLLALWCLLGFLFYWRTMRQSDLSDFEGATLLSGILFTLLIYSILMWFAKKMQESLDSGRTGSFPQYFRDNLVIVFIFVFLGLAVMMFTQRWLRQRHAVLEREKMQAEESSKAKSQFLFNMSHDIRTPMNAIIGYTHLAGLEEDVPPKVREYIEKIDISGKHLLTLINDVLEMSRIESGQMELMNEPGDLCEALETAWEMFREQMSEKGLGYDLDMQGVQDKYVIFDRNRFLRIILNLLSNAYKFTPEGGRVSVTMTQIGGSRYEAGDGQEQVFAHGEAYEGEKEWGAYEIRVKDTGIGMTKEFAEIVFEAFARERTSTVSRIQGTGLGMAITKSIVDAMQGTIDLVTETGKGSEFIIRLPYPLCDPEEKQEADTRDFVDASDVAHVSEADAAGKGKRILIAEDMEINRQILEIMIENLGYATDSAADGREALEKVGSAAPGYYDAVLMDIQMPVMDGYEATKMIRQLPDPVKAGIPIIAVTANAFGEDVRKAKETGMNGHVSKPVEPEELAGTLERILS